MGRRIAAAIVGAAAWAAATCALADDATRTKGDPWESFNRATFAIENALDKALFRPAARLYQALTPGQIGRSIHNVIVNLGEPEILINDILQGRLGRAAYPLARFVTNSTVGVLGLFDIARASGVPHHDNDFGQTLARYGFGPGPYLFLPLVGPTTVRDFAGLGVDTLLDPAHWAGYADRVALSTTRTVVGGLDLRVQNDAQLETILGQAADPYATLRSVYLQNREGEIKGGGPPIDQLPSFDDPSGSPAAAAAAPATAGASPVADLSDPDTGSHPAE